jgi:hypothetical protein
LLGVLVLALSVLFVLSVRNAYQYNATVESLRAAVMRAVPQQTSWIVYGIASTPHVNRNGVVFTEEAIEYGADHLGGYRTVCFNHDPEQPVGYLMTWNERAGTLYVVIRISKTRPDIWALIKDGSLTGLSISAYPLEQEPLTSVWGTGSRVTKLILSEVSIVALPANPLARITKWEVK